MNETLLFLLEQLLKKNKIKVNEEELRLQLFGHPSYPSLHAITGVLDHFNISNLAAEIPKTKEAINYLPDYFIAHIKDQFGDHFVLVSKTDSDFLLRYDDKKSGLIAFEEFRAIWTGIVLVLDTEDEGHAITVRSPGIGWLLRYLAPVLFLAVFIYFRPNLVQGTHFLLSMIGIFICYLIAKHEMGAPSAIVDRICSGAGKKVNCGEVLNSKGASFFGLLKIGDVGMVFFLGTALASFLLVVAKYDFTLPNLISLAAVPFTIYSILYQHKVVKKWCVMCLGVVLVLWLQAGLAAWGLEGFGNLRMNTEAGVLASISYFSMAALWGLLAPKLKREQELLQVKIRYNKFTRNTEIFNSLLSRSEPMATSIPGCREIVFGDENSHVELLVITNPLCGFCRDVHQMVHEIVRKKTGVRVRIRFNVSTKLGAPDTRISMRLLELYHNQGKEECLKAMDEAYTPGANGMWLQHWGEADDKSFIRDLESAKQWCQANNILFTPEVLVNGRSYPKEYEWNDLKYFLDELTEEVEEDAIA